MATFALMEEVRVGEVVHTLYSAARRVPEADTRSQSGERLKPRTLPTPGWKLAVHARFLGRFPRASSWLKKSESAARGGD
jgi:hypothetical protein